MIVGGDSVEVRIEINKWLMISSAVGAEALSNPPLGGGSGGTPRVGENNVTFAPQQL